MAQSSVEWLAKKVKDYCDKTGERPDYHRIGEWLKQAKAMHKEEIKEAYKSDVWYFIQQNRVCSEEDAEKYYDVTFGEDF